MSLSNHITEMKNDAATRCIGPKDQYDLFSDIQLLVTIQKFNENSKRLYKDFEIHQCDYRKILEDENIVFNKKSVGSIRDRWRKHLKKLNLSNLNNILQYIDHHRFDGKLYFKQKKYDYIGPIIESRATQQDDLNQKYSNDVFDMQDYQNQSINTKQTESRASQIDDLNQQYSNQLFQMNEESDLSSIIVKQIMDELQMQNQQQECINTKQNQSWATQIDELNQQYSNQSILMNEQSGFTSKIENNIVDELDMQNGFKKNFSKKHFPQMHQTFQPRKHFYDSKQLLSDTFPETVIRQDSSKNQQQRKIQNNKMDFSHLLSKEASELLQKYKFIDIPSLTLDKLKFVYDIDQAKQKFDFDDISKFCQILDSVNSRFDYLEMYLQDGRKDLAWTPEEDQILLQNMDCLDIENLIKNKNRQQIQERKKYFYEQ